MSELRLSFLVQAILFSFLLATSTSADINPFLFRWAFEDSTISTQLATCSPNAINIIEVNATAPPMGVPPYYMISYAVGQTPVTSLIGSDNLVFTVTQPAGSQLLLSVVDSLGNPGGSPSQLITVIEGQTTQCVTTPPNDPPFTVSANVTGSLEACAPWGITITGGSPPYNITLTETGEPFVTNVTMPFGLNRFTFINRAVSNGQLVAAVSDLTGRWASGTPVITPIGSSDYNCSGLPSSSGNATLIDQQDAQNNAAAASARHKHEAIIAIVVVLLLLLVSGAGGYAFWTLRRRRQARRQEMEATVPTKFPSMREAPAREDVLREEPPPAPAPGRWRVGGDVKQSAGRRDVEAPPYREYVSTPRSPGLRIANASPSPPPSTRPQLPRIQTTSPPVGDTKEMPPARYLESATGALPSSEPATALTSGGTSGSAARAASARFATFPVTSVRKPSAAGKPGAARSASAQAVSSTPARAAARVARNATVGTSTLAVPRDPFVISEEEDQVIMGEDYQGAERARRQPQGLPPRYQSLKGRKPRRDAD
ncbi:hypothetical protein HYPSUDRAFT_48401 [Hypholoma sublateritium FD-334 SS-4]|uniref:Mid2 domain-containing protein n=1 Tax=Hypholoma sublateritium (strain FD-334 SS-4) TaxID=945553 RepID=A0A0D2N8N6_HYPSF|nr:hypothetical protein HYPSUDRAFT_48401 [Hypholoma sublateritium FD-334 SS-4]